MKRYETFSVSDLVGIIADAMKLDDEYCRPELVPERDKNEMGDCTRDCRLCIREWLTEEMDEDTKTESGLITEE